MKVYDCDDEHQFSVLEMLVGEYELGTHNELQSFAPDDLTEARNRGFVV
jgi:hypothetical protein